jgi:hypothetical protein
MPAAIPAWAAAVGGIIAIVLPVAYILIANSIAKRKANDLIVKTNPPDPDGIADIDRLQRVQDDRNLPPVK